MSSVYPTIWKKALVVPQPKVNNQSEAKHRQSTTKRYNSLWHYRPINNDVSKVSLDDTLHGKMSLPMLPEEVLELIVQHFTTKDLIACSAVCLEWREKFNNNLFWKRFSFKHVKEYLEKTICEVEPPFQTILSTEERLEPICDWRVSYMRETHLMNNWKSGRFSTAAIRDHKSSHHIEMRIDNDGTHWLFLWLFLEGNLHIEVWNVNNAPQLIKTLSILPECKDLAIVAEGKLVLIQWNVVTTYSLDCNVDFLFRFTIEGRELLDSSVWDSTDKSDITTLNENSVFKCHNFSSLLVGHCKRLQNSAESPSSTMHIWDLNKKLKLKTESMLRDYKSYIKIDFVDIFKIDETQGIIRTVFLSKENQLDSILFVYDFKRLKFKDIKIECKGAVVWCGCSHNIIVTFSSHHGKIKLFDLTSKKLLFTKEFGFYGGSTQLQLFDNHLFCYRNNYMYVFDIINQESVHFVSSWCTDRLTVIEPRFVVVWKKSNETPDCSSTYQVVWDLKNVSRKLLDFDRMRKMITKSPSLVKQVACINGVIHVCTFW